jgi:hypothetical protein
MASNVHADDTLFIVVEPDFCIYEVDAAARLELLYKRLEVGRPEDYEDFGEQISDPITKSAFRHSLQEWRTTGQAVGSSLLPWPQTRSRTGASSSSSAQQPPSEELPPVPVLARPPKMSEENTHLGKHSSLEDLVLYANAAHRCQRGNLIWVGWNASQWSAGSTKTRGTSPTSGAQCVMLSCAGAKFLDEKAKAGLIPDMHMGNFLSKYCGLQWQWELGACYVQPPIGSFVAHESTTTPGAFLETHFKSKWAQEGTRPEKETHLLRYLCGFSQKGVAHWLHTWGIDLRDDATRQHYIWRTEAMPGQIPELCGLQTWHGFKELEEPDQSMVEDIGVGQSIRELSASWPTPRELHLLCFKWCRAVAGRPPWREL